MRKVIILKQPSGGVHIVHPAPEMFDPNSRTREALRSSGIDFKSDEEVLAYVAKKDNPNKLPFRIAEFNDLPKDRYFRDAWHDNNPTTQTVDVDIDAAKEVHKNKLRELRTPILKTLDHMLMIAEEDKDHRAKEKIIEHKKILRDITNLDLSDDLDVLKTQIPNILILKGNQIQWQH